MRPPRKRTQRKKWYAVPIRTHAIIDYLTGAISIILPFIIPSPDNPMKGTAFTFGAVILLYRSMTDYPLGLLRFIPFPIHKSVDLLAGAVAPIHFAAHGLPEVLFIALALVW